MNTSMQTIKIPPVSKFKLHKPEKVITFESAIMSKLFWRKTILKINDQGLICLNYKACCYRYQVYDKSVFLKHKNTSVIVRYDPNNLYLIHIYDCSTDNFIAIVKERLLWKKGNDKVFFKHVGKVKAITNAIRESRDSDDRLLEGSVQTSRPKLEEIIINQM